MCIVEVVVVVVAVSMPSFCFCFSISLVTVVVVVFVAITVVFVVVVVSDFLSCIGDIIFAAKDLHQLRLIIINVALHNVHAGSKQTLECSHIENWQRSYIEINYNIYR